MRKIAYRIQVVRRYLRDECSDNNQIMYDNNQITSARECARGRNGVKSSSFHAGFSSSATFLVSPPSLVFSFLLRIRIALLLFILISHRRSDPPTTKTSRALVSNALWRHWTLYDVVAGALIREDRGRSNGDAKSHPGNVSDNVTLIRALIRNRDLNSGVQITGGRSIIVVNVRTGERPFAKYLFDGAALGFLFIPRK